jgi:hypothetical protein
MPSTIAADRLEYILDEMRIAITHIEEQKISVHDSPEELNEFLLKALKKAHSILADAQIIAEQHGVSRLLIFGI